MKYSILTFLALTLSASAMAETSNFGTSKTYKKENGTKDKEPVLREVSVPQATIEEVDSLEIANADNSATPESQIKKSFVALQQTQDAARDEQKQNDSKQSAFVQQCMALFQSAKQLEASPQELAQLKADPSFQACEAAQDVAKNFNNSALTVRGGYQTSDGLAKCAQHAGYTLDYQSCKSTAKVYDALLVAAMGLEIQAEARAKNAQTEIAAKAQQKALSGDVQGAGLQASKDNSATMKQIHNERAAAYGAAVAALGAKLATWVGDAKSACKKVAIEGCDKKIGLVQHNAGEEVFANEAAKAVFIQALTKYTAEGLKAGIEASKYKSSEEAVAKIQNQYEEDLLDVQLDECALNPMAKKCLGPGTRVAGDSYSAGAGNFTVGGAGSNAFDLGAGPENFGEFGEDANIESQQVAAINSPFADDVKEAKDILDQAGAASAGAGGAAPGGGGGGGGGMGGGGSASLGNDTKTPDETPEEAEIKAKKASAGYASAGAKAFTGVKSSSEDSNPFASLFDQKGSSGGLEEDRSIASSDIDDKSSILFQKISRKYTEMHSNKRIQANNLELE